MSEEPYIPVRIMLRNNATREERYYCATTYTQQFIDDLMKFMWTEGNYACDCNRELDFERAGGADPDVDSVKCSFGRFTALYAELPDGKRITLDQDEHV